MNHRLRAARDRRLKNKVVEQEDDDGDGLRPVSPKRPSQDATYNRCTSFEGTCVGCGHLHLSGVRCGKVTNLDTLDKCRCTAGRKLKISFAERKKQKQKLSRQRAQTSQGWRCTNDSKCGATFTSDVTFFKHMNEDCIFREVWCENDGCKISCLARDLPFHEKYCRFKSSTADTKGGDAQIVRVFRDPQTDAKTVVTVPRPAVDNAASAPQVKEELSPARQADLLRLFDFLDTNGDGYLTPQELAPLLKIRSNRGATEEEVGVGT